MNTGGTHRATPGGWTGIRLAAALLLLAAAAAAQAQETIATSAVEPLVYGIQINGRPAGDAVLLRLDGQRLLARQADWDRWHLARPATEYRYEDEPYYALDQAPGFTVAVDPQRQEARLQFSTLAFAPSVLSATPDRYVAPQPPPGLGGFLNYELFGTHRVPDGAPSSSNLNGLVEVGAFNPAGVFTSQWLGQNLTDEQAPATEPTLLRRAVRLDTALTQDFPDAMQTLRLGDGIGAPGMWGRPVRYGGVRWTRNFSTQPGFVTLPQPSLRGETALPSVLDVYVDGMRRQSLEVPPGPFVVENLPTLTGQGEVQIVVRDLLGREQLLTDSYITGVQLLKAGLHDYSYEAGFVRENFGVISDDYGDAFAAGTHRYGFNDAFTGEARLEAGPDAVTAGVGGVVALADLALVSNAFAVSTGDLGEGALDVLTVQHNARRGVSLGGRLQVASPHFTQVGLAPGMSVPERSFSANLGYGIQPLGRFGLGYVNRDEAAPLEDFEAVTGTFTTSFRRVSLTLLAIDRRSPSQEYSIGLNLGMPFGANETASTGHRRRDSDAGDGSTQTYARLQRGLSEQEGWGYRVLVSQNEAAATDSVVNAEAGVGVNARYGSYGLEAATNDEIETYRATVSGGLGTLGGHTFASRKLSRSFAVVETGAEDVDLLLNNRLAGRTDASGVAILPYLQPYQNNAVSIDASNVPLDVEVHSGEFRAAPYYRSGVLIPLDVRRTRSAVIALTQSDGTVVPTGAVGRLSPSGEAAPVGKGGKLYLTGLAPTDNVVEVRWNHHRCLVTFNFPADAPVQPQLGPLECRTAAP